MAFSQAQASKPLKILVIRFSSIGDIVLTTPVIRCLKLQKNAEIHYLTKKAFKDVLIHNPYIDRLHFLNEDWKEMVSALKSERFDLVIDLHHNLRTLRLKSALGVKSYSFDKLNFEKWLLVNLKIDRMPKMHIVDRYLATTASLGVVNDQSGLDYFLDEQTDRVAAGRLPESHRNGFIGFVIGAQHATKRLPKEKIREICISVNKPVILLGGKGDSETAEFASRDLGHVYNACGLFSLNESAYLVSIAEKIITHDTGLMHIAAAFKKEILAIWGNTVPEFGMYPYLGDKTVNYEVKGLPCRPCSKIGFDKCPRGHFKCMNLQDIKAITAHLNV